MAFLNSAIRVLAADDPAQEAAEIEADDHGVVMEAEPDTVPPKRTKDRDE